MRSGARRSVSLGGPGEYFPVCISTGHVCFSSEGGMSCGSVLSALRCDAGELSADFEA